MSERRIGAYGGTFDPPHAGHVEVARAITHNFGLDEMLFIPAFRPPHKESRSVSDAYHRYAMAVLATMDEPRFKVSSIEIEAPDKPYTFETVERLTALYGGQAKLFFVMGADSFEEINTWREPARLLSTTNLIVAARPGYEVATSHVPDEFAANIRDLRGRGEALKAVEQEAGSCCLVFLTDFVSHDISSTQVRQKLRDGQAVDGLVPARVADYIEKYELYRR